MTALRHIDDCCTEAKRLMAELQAGIDGAEVDLVTLRRQATLVLYHAGRAGVDLARMPQTERRIVITPTLGALLAPAQPTTPLQAHYDQAAADRF